MGIGFTTANVFGNSTQEPFFTNIHLVIQSTLNFPKSLAYDNMKGKRVRPAILIVSHACYNAGTFTFAIAIELDQQLINSTNIRFALRASSGLEQYC